MSEKERDALLMEDQELRALLESWSVPDAPESLDKRVTAAYRRQISEAVTASNPLHISQRNSEVVKMKHCPTCQEEFADKFSFCPVDGTPLHVPVAEKVAPVVSDSAVTLNAASAVHDESFAHESYAVDAMESHALAPVDNEYHLTIIEDAGLASRLAKELREVAHESQLTWPEFKRDPFGFTKRTVVASGQMARRFVSRPNVALALGAALLMMLVIMVGVVLLEKSAGGGRSGIVIFTFLALALLFGIFANWMKRERSVTVSGERADDRTLAMATTGAGAALAATVVAFIFVTGIIALILWRSGHNSALADNVRDDVQFNGLITDTNIPDEKEPEKPDKGIGTGSKGRVGFNKGAGEGSAPKFKRASGGGGGGEQEQLPAQQGKIPPPSNIPVAIPKEPPMHTPSLPVGGTDIDPALYKDLPFPKYGDPHSKSTDPSNGPGTGGGMGTGNGTGVGQGGGAGVGPGNGGNMGGGEKGLGGGGIGGGNGTNGVDYDKPFNSKDVQQKARILAKPEAQYTEEARKNQVTGTVVLRAVLGSNGAVTGIRVVSPLPDGLSEKAIEAAHRIQFVPAMKDGRKVSQYIQIEYSFNLY